jgi:hypothetical protein
VRPVVLELELKREYQSFLQAPNRVRKDGNGRPQRDPVEIARWAEQHQLPIVDRHLQVAGLQIEYEAPMVELRFATSRCVRKPGRGRISGDTALSRPSEEVLPRESQPNVTAHDGQSRTR